MRATEIAIVGAGPAGLAATAAAVAGGAKVVLIDDNRQPGGQYFRQLAPDFRRVATTGLDRDLARAEDLLRIVGDPAVDYRPETTVWSISDQRVLAIAGPQAAGRIAAESVILCTGAHDLPVPFPGWTLPGVISAGGLQNLVKEQRLLPGRRAVVVGSGPLLLVATGSLLRGGASVAAVIEAAPVRRRVLPWFGGLTASPRTLRLAIAYRGLMMRHGVPLRAGATVIEALGKDRLEAVRVAPIDEDGEVDRGRARTIETEILITGFGLRASSELCRILGCRTTHADLRGGWLPLRNRDLETTAAGVYAAGDGAGIGGVEIALLEGALAGLVASRRVGRPASDHGEREALLRRRLARLERFRAALEGLYRPPSHFLGLITPETLICRCEEVTAARFFELAGKPGASAMALKGATRLGMGRCQGRFCQSTLASLLAARDGCRVGAVEMPRVRPPARLVAIADLLTEDVPEAPLPADPHLPRGQRIG